MAPTSIYATDAGKDSEVDEIPFDEFYKQTMKELMEREPTEESIVFGRMASLNFALEKLFDLKGISYKITQGQNITVLHNAMDAIEQDPENFFECDQAIKCSYGNSKAAMGQLVKHLIDHTRISHHEVTSRYVDVPGIEDMKTTVTRFLYLVEIETEHICGHLGGCN